MCMRDCRLCINSLAWTNSEEEALLDDYAECYLEDEPEYIENPKGEALKCDFFEYTTIYPRS